MSVSNNEIWMSATLGKIFNSSEKKFNINTTHTLIFVIVISVYAIFLQWRRKNKRFNALIKEIPELHLSKLPILGHAHHFLNLKSLAALLNKTDVDIPRVVWFGPVPFVVITHPADLEILFNCNNALHKHYLYKMILPYLGEGLITAPVHKWRQTKKMIMPAFNRTMLNSFVEVYSEKASVLNEILANENGKTFDIMKNISKCIIDAVCQTIMGIPFNGQRRENKFATAMARRVYLFAERTYNIFLHLDIMFMMTSAYWEQLKIQKMTTNFTTKVIAQKREELKNKLVEFAGEDKKKTFLEILVEAADGETKFSDKEIVDEFNTVYGAAIDTTANTIGFLLICLGIHPEIQERVYKEIVDVIGQDKQVEHSDIPKFEYLSRVIKETLRIFPTVPVIARNIRDADIKLGTCTLPEGCSVVYPILSINRSHVHFKDPLKFDPDRFLPEEIAKRPSLSYVPFGGGPRKCIGNQYAVVALKSVIATIVRKFRFETDFKTLEEVDLEAHIVLTSSKGYPIRAIPRE